VGSLVDHALGNLPSVIVPQPRGETTGRSKKGAGRRMSLGKR
jgi:hypothetical protein